MRIREIRSVPLFGIASEGSWTEKFSREENLHTLVQVVAEDGCCGWGSASTTGPLAEGALEVLRPLLIGQSAEGPAALSEQLHQHTFWLGHGGTITHVISGVDIAAWDLFGKRTGQPVSNLLGGRMCEKVKPYASVLMGGLGPMQAQLRRAVARGFRALKVGWGPFGRQDARTTEALVAAAREAVGPDVDLMVDAGGSDGFWPNGFHWALETARMLANYRVAWFEEPLRPDSIDDYVRLRERSPVPIAAGEVLCRRQTFLSWIERGAVDYLQPDVTKAGGISELHRIAQYATDRGIRVVPHGWNTAVGLAADLQLAAASAEKRWVEYMTPAPLIDDLFVSPPVLDAEGHLAIPAEPGLGFEWNLDAIARHSNNNSCAAAR